MSKWPELDREKLSRACNPEQFHFQTTADLEPLEGIIGQERSVRSMEFGLRVQKRGYNIFMTGRTGSGKLSYARTLLQKLAADLPVPGDWCYIYNFEVPSQPRAINLPPGLGTALREDMQELVEGLLREIPRAFEGDDFEKQKNSLVLEFQQRNSQLMEEMNEKAAEKGFALQRSSTGFMTVPLVDGKPLAQEEFEKLEPSRREELERHSSEVQMLATEILRRVQMAERETREKIRTLESQVGLFAVGHLIEALQQKYEGFPQVLSYLEAVKHDVLANLEIFRGDEEEQNQALPWLRRSRQNALLRYKVNLFVDNKESRGVPVIIETNPTYYNLVGRIEHENEWGIMTTDFTMIRPGALHRANGGYLVLQAKDVLLKPEAWEALKRVLLNGQVRIENMGEHYGLIAMATSKPEPIPVQVKVILIGSPYLYHLLFHYDEDFQKLFKIKADFDGEMPRLPDNELNLARFISSHCGQMGLRHFDRSGVAKVVEYSSRLAEHQQKLTTCFNELVEILYEADAWAAQEGTGLVNGRHVEKAITEKRYRSSRYEDKLQELFQDGTLLLDVAGWVAGQVNGLSVLDMGDYVFGKPSRITAATYLGERGLINIEREIRMSGSSHSKGVLILAGYLGSKYAQERPLSLSASITFEQLYEGVDGDSASSTELYAILSSLSGLPVNQALSVTGSVNQKGEIQPVGGINAKIEGYFEVCRRRGLTGEQGVLIPHQNVVNLMLRSEVVEAVREGKFHIYAVRSIDEGIEILTGVPAGQRRANGSYPRGTVNYLVMQKLSRYNRHLSRPAKDGGPKGGPKNGEEEKPRKGKVKKG